jgi:hypothetical protein
MARSKTRFSSLSLREKCCWIVSDYLTTIWDKIKQFLLSLREKCCWPLLDYLITLWDKIKQFCGT